jgi:soluble lytic murein transglycosylase
MNKLQKAVMRSVIIMLILAASVTIGFLYQTIADKIERGRYPQGFSEYVEKYSALYGVPEYIVYSVIKVESDYQSNAVSHAGAVGLMQITPDTFDWLMLLRRETLDKGLLYDPETNIDYGTFMLSYLYNEFGDWNTVFAAYNAGMARVKGWLADGGYTNEEGDLVDIPIAETRNYVPKINKAIEVYKRLYYQS